MTDRSAGPTVPVPVATIAAALFCAVLIYLALQIRAGQDPAIGAGHQAAAAAPYVVVRRLEIRRIVEEEPARGGSSAGAPAASVASAPVAFAPAPAPAAAPAPAPVVTRGS